MEFKHISVLLDETIEELHIKPDGIYVDGTLAGLYILALAFISFRRNPAVVMSP